MKAVELCITARKPIIRNEKPPKKATHRKTAGFLYRFENRTHHEQIVKSCKNLHRIFGNFKMEILDILGHTPGGSKFVTDIFEKENYF